MSEKAFSQLVVVGSSAGRIEALSELVSTLPEDFPAPIVLAQHLDPERESNLGDTLAPQRAARAHRQRRGAFGGRRGLRGTRQPTREHHRLRDRVAGRFDRVAQAPSHLKVGVEARPEKVVGYVEDDGRGFEGASKGDGSGRGIDSIRERAELVDDAFRVSSFLGTDTKIEASIPLNAGRIGGEGSYDGGRG